MIGSHTYVRRLFILAALALGVLVPGLLGAPAADAAGSLTLSIAVQPFGTKATATVTTSLPTVLNLSTRAVSAASATSQVAQVAASADPGEAPNGGRIHSGAILSPANYVTAHVDTLANLTPNTHYEVTVVATTQDGESIAGTAMFTTLKQRVRVTLREINITDDGDWFGDGEPLWAVHLDWKHGDREGYDGSTQSCFPYVDATHCKQGSYSEGRIFPRNHAGQFLAWTFAEENFDRFPDNFHLIVEGYEQDAVPIVGAVADFFQECLPLLRSDNCYSDAPVGSYWTIPQGVEWASKSSVLEANALDGGMHSTMTFTYELFYDNLSYPSLRNNPSSTWQ